MSYSSLLNQEVTLYNQSSTDEYGREVVGAGTTHRARFKVKRQNILSPTGEIIVIDAIAHFLPGVDIDINDKISYSGVEYKVVQKNAPVHGDGQEHHIRVALTRWQNT